MPKEQVMMGAAIALMSSIAVWKTNWLLQNTRKGEWLERRYGELKARLYLQSFFFLVTVFGVLLAANVILGSLAPQTNAAIFILTAGGQIEGELLNPDENPRRVYVPGLRSDPMDGQQAAIHHSSAEAGAWSLLV